MATPSDSQRPRALPSGPELARLAMVAAVVPTPALLYDLDGLTRQVSGLMAALEPIPNLTLCFAVKANRHPDVLRHLAGLGLGADVASIVELAAAQQAGLAPIVATAPGWRQRDWTALATAGVTPDCDSVSQVIAWGRETLLPRQIGLRLKRPLVRSMLGRPDSRFGVTLASEPLADALTRYGLIVTQLHVHTDAWLDDDAVDSLLMDLGRAVETLPDIRTINFGGGITELWADPARTRGVWQRVGAAVRTWNAAVGRPLRILLEPGMSIAGPAGYLVSAVTAADDQADGVRLATLDASRWDLFPWNDPAPLLQVPQGNGPSRPHDLAGPSCHEDDLFACDVWLAPLNVGDKVVFGGAGAYTSSMARQTHGRPLPLEVILDGRDWRQA